MKTVIRLIVVALLVVTMLSAVVARADEEIPVGFFIQNAVSGTMVDGGDGTYTLTLEGVGESVSWLVTAPYQGVAEFNTGQLALAWVSASEGFEVSGLFQIGDTTFSLNLSNPMYDVEQGAITYTAAVVVPEGEKEAPEVPESFDAATLYIIADDVFMQGLQEGAANAGARATWQCTYIMTIVGPVSNCYIVP